MSTLVAAPAGPAPLSDTEAAEMKEHLAFLRRYKEALRIRFNAAEDLLVQGQRPPTDRGVCHHLLAKVDRAVIEQALEREPLRSDAAARSRMLAGAVRLTSDVGVLLAYLEALAASRSRAEAADAFVEVAARIDFTGLSPARLTRLLQVLTETFTGYERVQVLLSLLGRPGFRDVYDAAAEQLPADVAEVSGPLRAVHRRINDDTPQGTLKAAPTAVIVTALEQILAGPDAVLRAYDAALRAGVVQLACGPGVPDALAERAIRLLLPTLTSDARTYGRLALRRAAQLLRHHADEPARELLDALCRAQPEHRVAARWRAALNARRVGRVAITDEGTEGSRLMRGLWLDGQRSVWLRTTEGEAAERVAREGALQARLALAGVAPVADHGAADGAGWVAILGAGTPLVTDPERPRGARAAFMLAGAAARVLHGLALRGIVLPDAAPERFLTAGDDEPQLVLADLDGVREDAPSAVLPVHAAIARALARALIPAAAATRVEPWVGAAVARALTEPVDLVELVRVIDQAALVAERD